MPLIAARSCMIFVFLSYCGCWISAAAAPARTALGIITILVPLASFPPSPTLPGVGAGLYRFRSRLH